MDQQTHVPHEISAGLTLVEVASVVTILLVALLGFAASITGGMNAARLNRENGIATQAARQVMERFHDYGLVPFDEVFASYNLPASDDPGGSGTRPGAHFAVELPLQEGDSDGFAGRIEFPTGSNELQLREDIAGFDLQGDGTIDSDDRAGDYRLLPVTVRVQWRSRGKPREIALETILTSR